MNQGKRLRLNRIFARDGKTVIAALDHGIAGMNPLGHLESPRILLPEVVKNGANAIITTPGIAKLCSDLFEGTGLILRIDGGPSALSGNWNEMEVILSAEDALRLGADAVILMGITGAPKEPQSLATLGRVAAHCNEWGLPLIAEILPGGFAAKEITTEQLKISARLAAELGADVVKIKYQGPPDAFKEIADSCYVPLVILGGSKQSPDQLIGEIEQALEAGARGAAVGRNVWQAEHAGEMIARLAATIHRNG